MFYSRVFLFADLMLLQYGNYRKLFAYSWRAAMKRGEEYFCRVTE